MASWRSVAIELGVRMENHAVCADHPADRAESDCPFCRDRNAYKLFRDKLDSEDRR